LPSESITCAARPTGCTSNTSNAPKTTGTWASAISISWSGAYALQTNAQTFRVRDTRVLGTTVFSELKLDFRSDTTTTTSSSNAPTIRVLDAFTTGGGGQEGVRHGRHLQIAQNVDFSMARQSFRVGGLIEIGDWDSTDNTNRNGTFTFRTLADYDAGHPSQYSRRVGDPAVAYSQRQAGWFFQDDLRLTRTLSVSVGARQELQTHLADRWNVPPRVGFTWAPSPLNVTVRGGWGLFYDWFDASLYEQTIRVDGNHQRDEIIWIRRTQARHPERPRPLFRRAGFRSPRA
jgi:hypothetical protein